MKTINIHFQTKEKKYPILIDTGLIGRMSDLFDFGKYTSLYVISDTNVFPIYGNKVIAALSNKFPREKISSYSFQAGENNKNITTVTEIYKDLAKRKFDRKGLIINLGGGVVTDLGGYVAATFKRGVDYINISTSITAMVDASIGGKVGIDLEKWKNYIGAFYQPKIILMDIDTLSTLNPRDYVEGFGEIIKHGLIRDEEYFEYVSSKKPGEFSNSEMADIIEKSCRIKQEIVEADEKETGLRKLLNFGHTVGHALESSSLASDLPLLHGEAIAIGIVAESKISSLLGYLTEKEVALIEKSIRIAGLPTKYKGSTALDEIRGKINGDKKNIAGNINWTLLNKIGKGIYDINVPEAIIIEGIRYVL